MEYKVMSNNRYCIRTLMSVFILLLLSGYANAQAPSSSDTVDFKFIKIKDSKFNFFALKSKDALKKYSKIYYVPMSATDLVLKKSGDRDIDKSWKKVTPEE